METSSSFELVLWWVWISYLSGTIGSLLSKCSNSGAFYNALHLPEWAPPSWLFAPVWFVLYGVNAYAAFLVRVAPEEDGWNAENTAPLILWLIMQIPLILWTWIFFTRRLLLWGFVDVAIACILAIVTDIFFWHVDFVAGILLVPLVLWLLYATALALFIWFLNKERDIASLPPSQTGNGDIVVVNLKDTSEEEIEYPHKQGSSFQCSNKRTSSSTQSQKQNSVIQLL